MYVSGAKWCDYVAWNKDWVNEGPCVWRVMYSKDFIKWMLPRVAYFMLCTKTGEEPDLHYIKPYCFGEVDDMHKTVKKELTDRFGTFLPPPVKVFALL